MKTAIVYDRVNKWGGAERVLLALHEIFPEAPLYTSVYDSKGAPWAKVFPSVVTSFLQNIPFAKNNHEILPVFMPFAFKAWAVLLIISSVGSLFHIFLLHKVLNQQRLFKWSYGVKNGVEYC